MDLSEDSRKRLIGTFAFILAVIVAMKLLGADDVEFQYAEKCEKHGLHYWNTGAKPHCEDDQGNYFSLDKLD